MAARGRSPTWVSATFPYSGKRGTSSSRPFSRLNPSRRTGAFCERTRTDNPAPESRISYGERVNVTWKLPSSVRSWCASAWTAVLMPYDVGTSARTLRRWVAAYRSAEREFGSGYVALLPGYAGRGNRNAKLPELSQQLMLEFIDKHYENLKQRTRHSVWCALGSRIIFRDGLVALVEKTGDDINGNL